MKREVKVPKWGLMIESITILRWLKQVGDHVEAGEALCEAETEKANADIESPVAGRVVELRGIVGGEYGVGETIAVIESDD